MQPVSITRDYLTSNEITERIEGQCTFDEMDLNINIHTNDTVERSTAQGRFTTAPKLTVSLMLEGDLDAALSGFPIVMTARNGPTGYCWVNTEEATLERHIRAGQRVRKLTISIPLNRVGNLFEVQQLYRSIGLTELNQTIAMRQWQPSPKALRYAEELFKSQEQQSRLNSLLAALGILRQAFEHLNQESQAPSEPSSNTRDGNRARAVREFIVQNINQPLTIQEVAEATSMSVSTLQRTFKSFFGCTVMEFIRIRRLELARLSLLDDGLTVGEAAFGAGYSCTANFSTAFQREFGYPPSSCTKR